VKVTLKRVSIVRRFRTSNKYRHRRQSDKTDHQFRRHVHWSILKVRLSPTTATKQQLTRCSFSWL